jgi:bacillithiol biosynthesis cysteine-adding enzyme BshC
MPAQAPVQLTVQRKSFSEFESFSRLFRDYCERYEVLQDFFAGDYRLADQRKRAADRTAGIDRDRETLADVLLRQNEQWLLDEAVRSNIEQLRDPESVVVVTGQQVGLFSGPLFTILKAITTVQMARQLADETGRPVVPMFWLGGEDHDFEEMASTCVLRQNEVVKLEFPRPPNVGPVGRIRLGDSIIPLVNQLDEILPPSDFKPDLMRIVRDAYDENRTFSGAFALLITSLFEGTGLVMIDSDDARLKKLASSLFRREIEDPERLSEGIRRTSLKLGENYHEQVQARSANLFLLTDDARYPLDAVDSQFQLRDGSRTYSKDELMDLLERDPAQFSPNVVLRPLMQDFLLPTAMYIGGPGEISYFAQYQSAYEWANVPMPLIYPRASITLVESKVAKILEKYGLEVDDFEEDVEHLFQRIVLSQMDADVDQLFTEAGRHVHEAVNVLKPELEKVDRTLVKSAEATRSALMNELTALKSRVVRAEKRSQDEVREQLGKAAVNLYPGGRLQERTLSILYFLNKYGLHLIDDLRAAISPDTTEHQIVEL